MILKLYELLGIALKSGTVHIPDEDTADEFEEFICNSCLYVRKGNTFILSAEEVE